MLSLDGEIIVELFTKARAFANTFVPYETTFSNMVSFCHEYDDKFDKEFKSYAIAFVTLSFFSFTFALKDLMEFFFAKIRRKRADLDSFVALFFTLGFCGITCYMLNMILNVYFPINAYIFDPFQC